MNRDCDSNDTERAVDSLQAAIRDLALNEHKLQDEFYLLQWLKAKNFSVSKTEAALRASFNWRKKIKAETIETEEFPEPLIKGNPFFWEFETKTGAPVCYVREDEFGIVGLLQLYGKETMIRFVIQLFLRIEKVVIDYNKRVRTGIIRQIFPESSVGIVAVFDGEGYGFKHVASLQVLQLYYEMAHTYSKYFPNLANLGIFVNANTFSMVSMRIFKPLVEGPYAEIRIFGTNEETWRNHVFEHIDEEQFRQLQISARNRYNSYKHLITQSAFGL